MFPFRIYSINKVFLDEMIMPSCDLSKAFGKNSICKSLPFNFLVWCNQLFYSRREVTRAHLARTTAIRKPLKEAGPAQSATTWTTHSARCVTGKDARTASQPRRTTEPNLRTSSSYCCTRRLYPSRVQSLNCTKMFVPGDERFDSLRLIYYYTFLLNDEN